MINESECFHNWPHKQISTQVDQQHVGPEAAKKEMQGVSFQRTDGFNPRSCEETVSYKNAFSLVLWGAPTVPESDEAILQ